MTQLKRLRWILVHVGISSHCFTLQLRLTKCLCFTSKFINLYLAVLPAIKKSGEYGLPQPKLLYPFKKTTKDYGIYEKDLTQFETLLSEWTSDKFMYPMHALKVVKDSNSAILQAEEIRNMSADVTSQFSVLFHLKFYLQLDPVIFSQFGKTGENVVQIKIAEDKLILA